MALPMDNLMRLLVPNRTPPSGAAMPTIAPLAVAPQPTAPVAPQLSPTAKYIADMQALMRGGIGQLSTGEKISALGQVLQAAGSRGAADPAAVLQNVRQQQMQKLNTQYQIAQLQQQAQQEQQQRAAIEKYKIALEPNEINALEGLPLEKQAEKVAEIAFRQKQLFSRDRDPVTGNVRLTYSGGDVVVTNEKMPAKTREIDVGDAVEIYDEDTNKLVMSVPKRMTAYQIASLAREDKREARLARSGGGGGGPKLNKPELMEINGKQTLVQWDPNNQRYVPFTQPGVTKPAKSGYQPVIPQAPTGKKTF